MNSPIPLWKIWLLAARPRTLTASIVPIVVGTALAAAQGAFSPLLFAATLAVSLLLQIAANFANDVFDFLKGADAARTGPTRVTQSGLLTARQMLISTGVIVGLAALIGLYLVSVRGWSLLIAGGVAIVCALAYTGGPWPLGYHGLGDLFVFICFGLFGVVGTYYVQTGAVTPLAVVASIPVGLLITNILVINNLRDIETDRAVGKRTLAVRIGDRATRWQYMFFTYGAYLITAVLAYTGAGGDFFWLPWLSIPLAFRLVTAVDRTHDAPTFNQLLARTSQLNLAFGVLFAISLWLS